MALPKQQTDFPDVDEVRAGGVAPRPAPLPLDYRQREPETDDFLRVVRRLTFAAGLAALVGGLGAVVAQSPRLGETGALWMAFGAGLLGLLLPIPGRWRTERP